MLESPWSLNLPPIHQTQPGNSDGAYPYFAPQRQNSCGSHTASLPVLNDNTYSVNVQFILSHLSPNRAPVQMILLQWFVLHLELHLRNYRWLWGKGMEVLPEVCGLRGTTLNASFSPEIKSQASEQRGKGCYLPSHLEEECKRQQSRLPAGLLEGMGTCNERAVSWCPGGRAKAGQEVCKRKRRSRKVSPNSMCEKKQFSPKSSVRLSTYAWERKRWDREKSEVLEKAGISLGVVRAAKRLSTSLLVLAAAYLWFWPQSGCVRPCLWKMWQGLNLKCGLWIALVWSKSEETVSSWPRSLSTWSHSRDFMPSLALSYRLYLVHGWL